MCVIHSNGAGAMGSMHGWSISPCMVRLLLLACTHSPPASHLCSLHQSSVSLERFCLWWLTGTPQAFWVGREYQIRDYLVINSQSIYLLTPVDIGAEASAILQLWQNMRYRFAVWCDLKSMIGKYRYDCFALGGFHAVVSLVLILRVFLPKNC